MKNVKKILLLLLIISMMLTGCQGTPSEAEEPEDMPAQEASEESESAYDAMVLSQDEISVTVLDARGNTLVIDKNPERVIPMQITLLDLWYLSGGEAVARTSSRTAVTEAAIDLPEVGTTTSPNIELLLAAEPDLVILNATSDTHVAMSSILDENGIQYFYTGTSLNPYQSVNEALYLFSIINGNHEVYEEKVLAMEAGVEEVLAMAEGKEGPSVLVLFGSSKSVRCELASGLVGEMSEMLGAENIVDLEIPGESKVDFSMEMVLANDPDIILVSVMGEVEAIRDRIDQDIASNEAWNSLTAVKEGRVYYLPKELYLYKPNARYPEAFQGLYDIFYGGVEK
jgi:iron complex transport system substrate-binding protein